MQTYSNQTQVPLSLAVYLATDHYDYEPDTVSATSLLKPTRQLVLKNRLPKEMNVVDVLSVVKSRMGTSIHDGIEKAWTGDYKGAMRKLGYPERVIERVAVNPEPHELTPDTIPVYMEKRLYRDFMGQRFSGKFDFIAEGRLEDFKSTSTYAWTTGMKDEDYQLQGSIYRWLDPTIITQDHMAIQFIFTDWMPGRAKQDPNYPQRQVEPRKIPLLSLEDTEDYVRNKLNQVRAAQDLPEDQLPLCTDKDLWRKPPQYKYYKNPNKTTRSTKNFDNSADAYARLAKDGNVGIVVEIPGEVVACKYCPAFPICSQKDALIADGSLCVE